MNQHADIWREQFTQAAQAVAARVTPAADLAGAFDLALARVREGEGSLLAAPGWGAAQPLLAEKCRAAGVELLTQGLAARAAELRFTLTPATWGVAETGTLVLDSRDEEFRLATMLADCHLAVLPALRLAPDLGALAPELERLLADAPGYLAFITGPSRTADIERVLTIGVHGPGELEILLTAAPPPPPSPWEPAAAGLGGRA
ncbi:MAG: lactate utilization protein [Deltaproteobacteria bacterium]|nr:lactate utilization protein [Deltaproteobacteria bacterium]